MIVRLLPFLFRLEEEPVARLVTIAGIGKARDAKAPRLSVSLGARKASVMVRAAPQSAHVESETFGGITSVWWEKGKGKRKEITWSLREIMETERKHGNIRMNRRLE